MSGGIDYGMGKTNIDHETGIRYGVISQHSISQAWSDSSEPVYGNPTCPKCGGDVTDLHESSESDYYCVYCTESWRSDECFPDEPLGFEYRKEDYVLVSCMDSEIMVIKSPFYTLAQFCSPCVPGAGNLNSPDDEGVKTYCLGHDWFEGNKAPYPVYSVATDNMMGD